MPKIQPSARPSCQDLCTKFPVWQLALVPAQIPLHPVPLPSLLRTSGDSLCGGGGRASPRHPPSLVSATESLYQHLSGSQLSHLPKRLCWALKSFSADISNSRIVQDDTLPWLRQKLPGRPPAPAPPGCSWSVMERCVGIFSRFPRCFQRAARAGNLWHLIPAKNYLHSHRRLLETEKSPLDLCLVVE